MIVEVRRARDDAELTAATALAEAVFQGEQGVAPHRDTGEPGLLRLVAVADDGTVVGCCRLVVEGEVARLGSLAVARDARGHGYGGALLAEAEREARAAGMTSIRLNAQTAALPLYERAGYLPRGRRFQAEGIEHQAMEKALARGA